MDAARTMDALRPVSYVRARTFITEFPLEWAAVLAIVLIDAVWALRTGFTVTIAPHDVLGLAGILSVGYAMRLAGFRGATIAEYFALTVVSASAFAVLSYLGTALSLPLADRELMRLDRALGFDWLLWFNDLAHRPALMREMYLAYASMPYQGIYFVALFGLLRDRARLCEIFWVVFVASGLTTLMCTLLPALGTFDAFRLGDLGGYLSDIHRLRDGGNLHFEWARLTGIVTFPSFHTSMALIYIYAFRKMGLVSALMAVVNVLMLPTIPFIGGHYLVDMVGGAVVAAASIAVTRLLAHTGLARPAVTSLAAA
jgi:hypothetical protein